MATSGIEDTPQQAASQRDKAELMMEIERIIQQHGMTQAEAANMPQQSVIV